MQEAHGLKIKNDILHSDLSEVTELSEKLKEDIGDSVLKLDDVKRKHMALEHKCDAMYMENEYLKQKVVKLDIEKMATLNGIEKLLDIKLARLENNIIGQIQSNFIPKVIPEVKNTNINITTPGTSSQQPTTCNVSSSNEKTFDVECIELVKQVNTSYLINI
ncbi:uncharacterized protein LOC112595560 [Melanaphis sacchari]|uniref:uncharacterized protein LOC112595560 n=1 Tax=Melanaphis sacchari TaxID=742174 RepID=UPI000DC13A71|nr:uncharacterized protein LOC112595560 [Melanaphis sacchari]